MGILNFRLKKKISGLCPLRRCQVSEKHTEGADPGFRVPLHGHARGFSEEGLPPGPGHSTIVGWRDGKTDGGVSSGHTDQPKQPAPKNQHPDCQTLQKRSLPCWAPGGCREMGRAPLTTTAGLWTTRRRPCQNRGGPMEPADPKWGQPVRGSPPPQRRGFLLVLKGEPLQGLAEHQRKSKPHSSPHWLLQPFPPSSRAGLGATQLWFPQTLPAGPPLPGSSQPGVTTAQGRTPG